MGGDQSPRAVVADDSHFMRSVISGILADGGIEATERIAAEHPIPILVLSAHTDENADVTFEALDSGAVDSVRSAGTAATATTATGAGTATEYVDGPTVVIGSSTGGPTVVETVLSELPLAADLRVLVVQHMPDGFTGRFAERLDARSEYAVSEATDGARVGGGEAVIAAGDYHMAVDSYRTGRVGVSLTQDPPVNNVRPAVDVTMETAAATVDGPLVGVVLTGMGEDGAAGIEAIAEAGGTTLAQDEATSAVFGMPKRAIETGCVDGVAPVDDVAAAILDACEVT